MITNKNCSVSLLYVDEKTGRGRKWSERRVPAAFRERLPELNPRAWGCYHLSAMSKVTEGSLGWGVG